MASPPPGLAEFLAEQLRPVLAVVEAAGDVWTPCDDDPRWCSRHSEKQPCAMAVLGVMLTRFDHLDRRNSRAATEATDAYLARMEGR